MSDWIEKIKATRQSQEQLLEKKSALLKKITDITGSRKTILFFDPIPWAHNCLDLILADALRLRGHNVVTALCGSFPICEMKRYNHDRPDCSGCFNNSLKYPQAFNIPHCKTSDFISESDKITANEVANSIPLSDLFSFTFHGIKIGEFMKNSVTAFYRHLPDEWFTEMESIARLYIESGILAYCAAKNMIEGLGVDILVTTGGKSPLWGPVFEVAEQMGKTVINWEDPSPFQNSFVFSHKQPALQYKIDNLWEKNKSCTLSEVEKKQVADFRARVKHLLCQKSAIENIAEIRDTLKLSGDRKIVTLYSGLPWDGSIYGLDKAFKDIFSWILWMIDYAIKRQDIDLIIRCHPAEASLGTGLVPVTLTDMINKHFHDLPANIKIVKPESRISSYLLAELSDINMVYLSTIGLEIAAMGKRSWVVANPHYANKGFTVDIDSPEDLRRHLDNNNFSNCLSNEQIELAEQYTHLLYFRHIVRMPFFQGHEKGEYSIDSFEKLLPCGDPTVDDLCNCIIENKDFIDVGQRDEKQLVSIITPFHNMEHTIAETIESVINQSYKNWEMILIDDGSQDQSRIIAESYAQANPERIRIINHPGNTNRGASASRNLGFANAKGELIAYLDADDIWVPDKLIYETDILKKHANIGMVMSPVKYFFDPAREDKQPYEQDLSSLDERIYNPSEIFPRFLQSFAITPCPSATLIRRQVIEQIGGWENVFKRNCTDQVLWAKISSRYPIYVSKKIVTCYRQHLNSSWEIAHRENNFNEQEDKFWCWLLKFSDKFSKTPEFQHSIQKLCQLKMSDSAKKDYYDYSSTLQVPGGTTLNDRIPWLNYKSKRWLDEYIKPGMNVFEYGTGGSTLYFLGNRCKPVSIEHDRQWYQNVQQAIGESGNKHSAYHLIQPQQTEQTNPQYRSEYPGYENMSFEEYVRKIETFDNGFFDIILIDGRARVDCLRHAIEKVRPGGTIILDNAERDRYQNILSSFKDFKILDFYGFGPYEPELWQTLVLIKPLKSIEHDNKTHKGSIIERHIKELYGQVYPEPLNEIHKLGTLQSLKEYEYLMKPADRVLDVGCGQGFAIEIMKQKGLRPTGITIGAEDFNYCRQKNLDVLNLDMSFMDEFEDQTFDGLFVRHALEHSPMPVLTLKEFWRVLKPSGWIIVIVPTSDAIIYDNHYSLFEPKVWASLFADSDFEVEIFNTVSKYEFNNQVIEREYPEYQFVLRRKEKSLPGLSKRNIELVEGYIKSNESQEKKSPVNLNLLETSASSNEISFGSLRRVSPVSRVFGSDRMTNRSIPLCWNYIMQFLLQNAQTVKGRVLEIGENKYTKMFGGDRVTKSDILHATADNPGATIIADLTKADNIPSNTFDCIICTQTLQCIYDVKAALRHLYRILKPGGTLLVTSSGISQISRYDMDRWGDYWRFTTASFQRLFEEYWPKESIAVESCGNVLVATAYLQGLVTGDLSEEELNAHDDDYQMILTAKAVKPATVPTNTSGSYTDSVDTNTNSLETSNNEDVVEIITSGWDDYAKNWESDKFKVVDGFEVKNIGDEWTGEDGKFAINYGLSDDTIKNFDEYITSKLLNVYLPPRSNEGMEIGPGGGRFTKLLVPGTKLLHLVDSSQAMLKNLKQRFVNNNNIKYYHTEGMTLPSLQKDSLDYVIALDVFVHFEPRLVYWYLQQIEKLLKPGGTCIIHYANATTSIGWQQFENDLALNVKGRSHFASFGTMCPQLMEKFLQSLGFEVISTDTGIIPRDAIAVFRKPTKSLKPENSHIHNPLIIEKKLSTPKSPNSPIVLLYHRVANDPIDSQLLAVSPDNFEDHLKELADKYRVVPLRQILAEALSGSISPNTVALTFDDGYADNLINALPLLEKYGMHATIFVTSGMVGSDREFWWDALERIFVTCPNLPSDLKVAWSGGTFDLGLTTPQQKLKAMDELGAFLREQPHEEIAPFIDALYDWAGLTSKQARPSHLIVNNEQLNQLAASPSIEIGSHTITHTKLSSLSLQKQQYEIRHSRQQLENIIKKPVRLLSYPFGAKGDYTNETMSISAEEGYEAGIANIQGPIKLPIDMYAVPRILVRNWSRQQFTAWLSDSCNNRLEAGTLAGRPEKIMSNMTAPAC